MIKQLLIAATVVGYASAYAMTVTATLTDTGAVVVDAKKGGGKADDAAMLRVAYDREKVRPGAKPVIPGCISAGV